MAIRRMASPSLSVVIIRETFCGGQIFIVNAKGGKRKFKNLKKKYRLKLRPSRASKNMTMNYRIRASVCHI